MHQWERCRLMTADFNRDFAWLCIFFLAFSIRRRKPTRKMKILHAKLKLFLSCAFGVCLYNLAWMFDNAQEPSNSFMQKILSKQHRTRKVVRSGMLTSHQPRILFYNRVEKCGSRSLITIAQRLAKKNKFDFSHSYEMNNNRPGYQDVLAEIKKISNLNPPIFYHSHIHYLDFEKFGYEKPIYINLIRDPTERFVSWYNYMKYGALSIEIRKTPPQGFELNINEFLERKNGSYKIKEMFQIGMYLCGMSEICTTPSDESVALAIKHVDEDYLFVGLTEEFDKSLRILEKMLPDVFSGALEDWMEHGEMKNRTTTLKYDKLTDEWREILRTQGLAHEYEIYNHVRRKFESLKKKLGIE